LSALGSFGLKLTDLATL